MPFDPALGQHQRRLQQNAFANERAREQYRAAAQERRDTSSTVYKAAANAARGFYNAGETLNVRDLVSNPGFGGGVAFPNQASVQNVQLRLGPYIQIISIVYAGALWYYLITLQDDNKIHIEPLSSKAFSAFRGTLQNQTGVQLEAQRADALVQVSTGILGSSVMAAATQGITNSGRIVLSSAAGGLGILYYALSGQEVATETAANIQANNMIYTIGFTMLGACLGPSLQSYVPALTGVTVTEALMYLTTNSRFCNSEGNVKLESFFGHENGGTVEQIETLFNVIRVAAVMASMVLNDLILLVRNRSFEMVTLDKHDIFIEVQTGLVTCEVFVDVRNAILAWKKEKFDSPQKKHRDFKRELRVLFEETVQDCNKGKIPEALEDFYRFDVTVQDWWPAVMCPTITSMLLWFFRLHKIIPGPFFGSGRHVYEKAYVEHSSDGEANRDDLRDLIPPALKNAPLDRQIKYLRDAYGASLHGTDAQILDVLDRKNRKARSLFPTILKMCIPIAQIVCISAAGDYYFNGQGSAVSTVSTRLSGSVNTVLENVQTSVQAFGTGFNEFVSETFQRMALFDNIRYLNITLEKAFEGELQFDEKFTQKVETLIVENPTGSVDNNQTVKDFLVETYAKGIRLPLETQKFVRDRLRVIGDSFKNIRGKEWLGELILTTNATSTPDVIPLEDWRNSSVNVGLQDKYAEFARTLSTLNQTEIDQRKESFPFKWMKLMASKGNPNEEYQLLEARQLTANATAAVEGLKNKSDAAQAEFENTYRQMRVDGTLPTTLGELNGNLPKEPSYFGPLLEEIKKIGDGQNIVIPIIEDTEAIDTEALRPLGDTLPAKSELDPALESYYVAKDDFLTNLNLIDYYQNALQNYDKTDWNEWIQSVAATIQDSAAAQVVLSFAKRYDLTNVFNSMTSLVGLDSQTDNQEFTELPTKEDLQTTLNGLSTKLKGQISNIEELVGHVSYKLERANGIRALFKEALKLRKELESETKTLTSTQKKLSKLEATFFCLTGAEQTPEERNALIEDVQRNTSFLTQTSVELTRAHIEFNEMRSASNTSDLRKLSNQLDHIQELENTLKSNETATANAMRACLGEPLIVEAVDSISRLHPPEISLDPDGGILASTDVVREILDDGIFLWDEGCGFSMSVPDENSFEFPGGPYEPESTTRDFQTGPGEGATVGSYYRGSGGVDSLSLEETRETVLKNTRVSGALQTSAKIARSKGVTLPPKKSTAAVSSLQGTPKEGGGTNVTTSVGPYLGDPGPLYGTNKDILARAVVSGNIFREMTSRQQMEFLTNDTNVNLLCVESAVRVTYNTTTCECSKAARRAIGDELSGLTAYEQELVAINAEVERNSKIFTDNFSIVFGPPEMQRVDDSDEFDDSTSHAEMGLRLGQVVFEGSNNFEDFRSYAEMRLTLDQFDALDTGLSARDKEAAQLLETHHNILIPYFDGVQYPREYANDTAPFKHTRLEPYLNVIENVLIPETQNYPERQRKALKLRTEIKRAMDELSTNRTIHTLDEMYKSQPPGEPSEDYTTLARSYNKEVSKKLSEIHEKCRQEVTACGKRLAIRARRNLMRLSARNALEKMTRLRNPTKGQSLADARAALKELTELRARREENARKSGVNIHKIVRLRSHARILEAMPAHTPSPEEFTTLGNIRTELTSLKSKRGRVMDSLRKTINALGEFNEDDYRSKSNTQLIKDNLEARKTYQIRKLNSLNYNIEKLAKKEARIMLGIKPKITLPESRPVVSTVGSLVNGLKAIVTVVAVGPIVAFVGNMRKWAGESDIPRRP